ncbi:MAG: phage portal protein, partial [Thermodesulfovibrionia bacterium]|nr:phage portal protein [Thermodesulfovibrionia bacterium]
RNIMTTEEVTRLLEHGNEVQMTAIFENLIKDSSDRASTMETLDEEYEGSVPILERADLVGAQANKSNVKIPNDYRGIIVDQCADYVFGNPIEVSYEDEDLETEARREKMKPIRTLRVENSFDALDYATAINMGISGRAARLLYFDENAEIRVMNLQPWEVIFVYDASTHEVQFAMYHYDYEVIPDPTKPDKKSTAHRVEWYNKKNVYFYIKMPDENYYVYDDMEEQNPLPHGFEYPPLIDFWNNRSAKGDFEKVRESIDAYDETVSDNQNEHNDFRHAYLIWRGVVPEQGDIDAMKLTGAIASDEKPTEFDVSFLTKAINVDFTKHQQSTLNDNIYKQSKRVDMSDEKFSGQGQSGESRKWKLLALVYAGTAKFNLFKTALMYQYKVIASGWKNKRIELDYTKLSFTFKPNLPVDLLYWGKVAVELLAAGFSKKTVFGLLPFIEDSEKEIAQKAAEVEEEIDLLGDELEPSNGAGVAANAE